MLIGRRNRTKRALRRWSRSGGNITAGDTVLSQDFKEFIQSLNDNHVRYLVIGGYAVAFHGHPRYTKDLDVWIDLSQENAERMVAALAQFGFASLGLQAKDFLDPDQVIQLGHPPNRIDILTALAGVDFENCYAKKVLTTIDGVEVTFIDLKNLKENKRTVGRLQDLADLEKLK